MTIYGVTKVNSAGYRDGTESKTFLFLKQEDQEECAYKLYDEAFWDYDFDDPKMDEAGRFLLEKDEFLKEIKKYEPLYAVIQGFDSHVQIELFQQEV